MKSRSERQTDWFKASYEYDIIHDRQHEPKVLYWTSKATLTTDAGTPFYALRGKRIIRCKITVAGAPSSTNLVGDILIDGNSAFSALDDKPMVLPGNLEGEVVYLMGGRSVPPDGKVQCKITTISSATGPAVFEIEYI